MTLQLSTEQIAQAEQTLTQGGAAAMWQYLASQGDTYATKAHSIIRNPSGFFGQIVTQSWISAGADLKKFPDVAETYAGRYLNQIQANKGVLPNGGEIESAYRKALEFNQISVNAAIDSTMHIKLWTFFLGLEPSRQTGETAFPDRALLDQVMQFGQAALAVAGTAHSYFYDEESGHWYLMETDSETPTVRFDQRADPDMECRLSWWIRAGRCAPLGSIIADAQSDFAIAERPIYLYSPLTLDLDGDGIETIGKRADIHFDHDGNRFSETTGWVGKDDGLLVWDRDANGRIDSGRELFGNHTLLTNGSRAANGFGALAELDVNSDGKIDANDTAFGQLGVWKDANSNGMTEAGELLTLSEAGVKSLGLAFTTQSVTDAQGNQHLQAGQYTRNDGSSRNLVDVWFDVDTARAVALDRVPVSEAIAAQPDLPGMGNVHSLHQAIARDTSNKLLTLLQNFLAAPDRTSRQAILTDLLFAWTASDRYAANSRGDFIDGRKLYTLEAFLGESFIAPKSNASIDDASVLTRAFDNLSQFLYSRLVLQTSRVAGLYDDIGLIWNAQTQAFALDVSGLIGQLRAQYTASPATGADLMNDIAGSLASSGSYGEEALRLIWDSTDGTASEFDFHLSVAGYQHITGSTAGNTLNGQFGKPNHIDGGDGDDYISGGSNRDLLVGGAGNDTLHGRDGNDRLSGKSGNDTLSGGRGSDTYFYKRGDGQDTINHHWAEKNAGDVDTIHFVDLKESDLTLERSGTDLLFKINGTSDWVRVAGFLGGSNANALDQVKFADGIVWNKATLLGQTITGYGTAGADFIVGYKGGQNITYGLDGNDQIYGGDSHDLLDGGTGNDTLDGSSGNDSLTGGAGSDSLSGGNGSDTYIYRRGDGQDTINDGGIIKSAADVDTIHFTDLKPTDLTLERSGNDLMFKVNGTSDWIRVVGFLIGSGANALDQVKFADGTVWDKATLLGQTITGYGTAGNDTIGGYNGGPNITFGLDGNDQIFGGSSNDLLDGGAGNDTLNGNTGNDSLTGGTGADTLTGSSGSDTYIYRRGDGQDTINDSGITKAAGDVDTILFADLTSSDLTLERSGNDLMFKVNGTSDWIRVVGFLIGSGASAFDQVKFADGIVWDKATLLGQTITGYGTAGDDTIGGYSGGPNISFGLEGNDNIFGGSSNDLLDGGAGNDTLNGNTGNDKLTGGTGNDTLTGGLGSDIYVFNLGDGSDLISEGSEANTDVLQLGTGLTAANTQLNRDNMDLMLTFNATDKVRISGYFSQNRIEQISFADGTNWDFSAVTAKLPYDGTANNDTLYGLAGVANRINGLGGNDIIYGKDKDDVLAGGTGNDTLNGSFGSDMFIYARGDGQDTISNVATEKSAGDIDKISFTDLNAADLTLERAGADLLFKVKNTEDWLKVSNFFGSNPGSIDQVQFADGTVWDKTMLLSQSIQYLGTTGNDVMTGYNGGPNSIYGLAGNDTISGGDSNDILEGGTGSDTLYGYAGNDTYGFKAGDGPDTVSDTGGADILRLGTGLNAGSAQVSKEGNDLLLGFSDTDKIRIVNYFTGGEIEQILFADGTNWDRAAVTSKFSVNGTDAPETLTGIDGVPNTINGLGGNDTITGKEMGDTLAGGTGSDTIGGGAGNDTYLFNLGDGQESLIENASEGMDVLKLGTGLNATSTQVGLDAFGTLSLTFNANDSVRISNYLQGGGSIESIVFADGAAWSQADVKARLLAGTSGNDQIFGFDSDDNLNGLAGDDTLRGSGGNDTIIGGDGRDSLYGDAGNDQLHGGAGNDNMSGEDGNDTYLFNRGDGQDNVSESHYKVDKDVIQFGAGIAPADILVRKGKFIEQDLELSIVGTTDSLTVRNYFAGWPGAAEYIEEIRFADGTVWTPAIVKTKLSAATEGDDQLSGTEGADSLDGLGGNDTLKGQGGDDILNGGTGVDILQGGLGNDTYVVDNTGDTITESAGQGTDTVQSAVTYTLQIQVENMTLTGNSAVNATGNELNNTLTGNSANNTLDGKAGTDILRGGQGDDTYVVDNAGDSVIEAANEGLDTVQSSVTFTLADNVENLTLTGTAAINGSGNSANNKLTGNSAVNTLIGNAGDDTLDGAAGADKLLGGAGNDIYVVDNSGDVVTELASEGTDTVQSKITYTLGVNVENLTLTGTSTINGTGNELNNVITGNTANNTLRGNAGNDTLNGGGGTDTLIGGTGNDIYVVDSSGDIVTELASEGTDTVQSKITYTLGANVEKLTLTGTSLINGTGNELGNTLTGNSANNTLTGNAGNDTLDGAAGADTLVGGTGNDTYVVDNTGDIVTESASSGTDTVRSSITYTLGSNLEHLTLLGTAAINGTGNSSSNTLTGNSAINTLTGGGGSDKLDGAGGGDTLAGGTGNDTYVLGRGYGTDTVTENDTTTGNTDVAQFTSDIAVDQLWFRHVGNNLEVSVVGTADNITIKDWYLGSKYQVEQFKAGGKMLLNTQVESLVSAMAAFSPPPAGQTTLPQNYQDVLAPKLAANWK